MSESQNILGTDEVKLFRTGSVIVGNIGNSGFVSLPCSGGILTGFKNTAYNDRDATVNLTYKNLGYSPQVFISTIYNPISDSRTNDLSIHTL